MLRGVTDFTVRIRRIAFLRLHLRQAFRLWLLKISSPHQMPSNMSSRDRPFFNFDRTQRPPSAASSGTLYRPPSRLLAAHPTRETIQINVHNDVSTEYDLEDVAGAHQNDGDHNAELDPDSDSLNEVVMAVDIRDRGTVGCSYYVAREEKLYFMEDAKLVGPDIIEACKVST